MSTYKLNCAGWLALTLLWAGVPDLLPRAGAEELAIQTVYQTSNGVVLTWQGATGMTFAVETADYLDAAEPFAPYAAEIVSGSPTAACTNPLPPNPILFYRVVDAAFTNPLGRVVVLSDLHLSPMASAPIVTQLLAGAVADWDLILQADTNGYFTPDATGKSVVNPRLFNSALDNARAACPAPDAVLLLGDFEYYDFKEHYRHVTGDEDEENWRTLLLKQYEYVLMKTARAFPGAPLYPCLGNNDTFSNDYEIAAGDDFFRRTAGLFYEYGLSHILPRAEFEATYTNAGHYAAPFRAGEIIALESVFFSVNHPGGLGNGSNQLAYLESRLNACETQNRPVWILSHIPPGISAFDTWAHWRTGGVQQVATNWREDFLDPFAAVVARHRGTIGNIFCGHYHLRAWQLANDPADSNVTAAIQIMDGLLYNHGDNPGFSVLTYDRRTLQLRREAMYGLAYDDYLRVTGPAVWDVIFNTERGLRLANLGAERLLDAWTDMAAAGSAGYEYYRDEYNCGRPPYVINATNWPVYHGEMRWINPAQFLHNVAPP